MPEPTVVKVADKNPSGFKLINETDFRADEHTLYDPNKAVKKATKAELAALQDKVTEARGAYAAETDEEKKVPLLDAITEAEAAFVAAGGAILATAPAPRKSLK